MCINMALGTVTMLCDHHHHPRQDFLILPNKTPCPPCPPLRAPPAPFPVRGRARPARVTRVDSTPRGLLCLVPSPTIVGLGSIPRGGTWGPYSGWWPRDTPVGTWTTSCVSIQVCMGTWLISTFRLVSPAPVGPCVHIHAWAPVFNFLGSTPLRGLGGSDGDPMVHFLSHLSFEPLQFSLIKSSAVIP